MDSNEQDYLDYLHTPLQNFVLQVENFITTEGSAQIQDTIHTRKQSRKVEYNALSNSVPKFMKTKIQVCPFGKLKEALEIQDKFHHELVEELLAFDGGGMAFDGGRAIYYFQRREQAKTQTQTKPT